VQLITHTHTCQWVLWVNFHCTQYIKVNSVLAFNVHPLDIVHNIYLPLTNEKLNRHDKTKI